MNILIIINDGPYGTEKAYNALRLANQVKKDNSIVMVWIFLMADAASCAVLGQVTPNGYYNIERLLQLAIGRGAEVKICGTCAKARGITTEMLIAGASLSTMEELSAWTVAADKTVVF